MHLKVCRWKNLKEMKMNELFKIDTPCFIIKETELQKGIDSFKSALDKYFPRNILGYSLKTNSCPYILEKILKCGGYAEVVSYDEYEVAKLCNFSINEIIYNGPLKSFETFKEAIESGAIVNIETKREIEWLKKIDDSKVYNVGIRLNIDLKIISEEDAKLGEDYSRFGFSSENDEFSNAIQEIRNFSHIRLAGIHIHRTTKTRAVNVYRNLARYVGEIIQKYSLSIDYIDVGGGYYGIMQEKPTFDEYMFAVSEGLKSYLDLQKITIIVEPGNAIVASTFDFLTTVIDMKKIREFIVLTIDGSRNDIDPFYQKSNYFYEIISSDCAPQKEILMPLQKITGCTCLEYDKLFDLTNQPEVFVKDRIIFHSVGAYTMTLSPLFIRFFPKIYVKKDGNYTLWRERWTAKNFLHDSL